MHGLKNNILTIDGWQVLEKSFNPDGIVTTGSNFMIGNGFLGYRGTFPDWTQDHYVACTVTDTWDTAPGSEWRELCTVPNGLFSQFWVDGELVTVFTDSIHKYYHELNFHTGVNKQSFSWQSQAGNRLKIHVEKYASNEIKYLLPMRLSVETQDEIELLISCGIDGRIWSLNGEHFTHYDFFKDDGKLGIETHTHEFNIQVDVVTGVKIIESEPIKREIVTKDKRILHALTFKLRPGERVCIEQIAAVCHSNDVEDPQQRASLEVSNALERGYDSLKKSHQETWDKIWAVSDIIITGDIEAQTLTRFNIYQAIIATPTHAKLPIGARGLSCQVYQGAAFWDQETFNLPMYLYTHPQVAKMLLKYRYDTLSGARKKALDLGYYGAFYAWTSGKSGEELFPDYFFTDVLTGRKIHNHFNSWQIHISPDIVYALWVYYEATGDWDFILNYGAEIVFEVAQFLIARAHYKVDKQRYEYIRVLGPDEYHENVDNNAYTNYMAQFSLEKAAYIFYRMANETPQKLDALLDKTGLAREVITSWVDVATKVYLPQPDPETLLIEQFDGFFKLEDITPAELRKRLIHQEEYWGWPNGIAVEAQVLKQADILQLFALLDDRFSSKVMRANYDYYEPRTEHGSSLSPSVHAIIATWSGYPEKAYTYFLEGASIDLYNASKKVMSGGSFLGGIHTAAAGGVWQMIVKGFAGFKLVSGVLHFKPALPQTWECLTFKLVVDGNWLTVNINQTGLSLQAANQNPLTLCVCVENDIHEVKPGAIITVQ